MKQIFSYLTVMIFLLVLGALLTAEAVCGTPYRFQSEPHYETANRWYASDGKKVALNRLEITFPLTIRRKMTRRLPEGTYLIFRKTALTVTASTKNKMLLQGDEDTGSAWVMIPADEVIKGEEITLRLVPKSGKTGTVDSTVRLQTKNDFYFSLLAENKKRLLTATGLLLLGAFFLQKRKRLAFGCLLLLLPLQAGSTLAQFLFGVYGIGRACGVLGAIGAVVCFAAEGWHIIRFLTAKRKR